MGVRLPDKLNFVLYGLGQVIALDPGTATDFAGPCSDFRLGRHGCGDNLQLLLA